MSMLARINKKAMALYYPVMWGLLVGLSAFWVLNAYQNTPKNIEFIGQVFLDSYKEVQNVLDDLDYAQQSAKYSVYNAIYPLAKRGFYFKDPCQANEMGYIMWKNIFLNLQTQENVDYSCYPTKEDIKVNYAIFLNEELNRYFKSYTYNLIPENNYDLIFDKKEKGLEIKGVATQKIRTPPNPVQYKQKIMPTLPEKEQDCLSKEGHVSIFVGNILGACEKCPGKASCESYRNEAYCKMDPCNLGCKWEDKCKRANGVYAVDPSFEIEISYNFIYEFEKYVSKAKEMEDKITNCLRKGSGKPYDDDLTACSDIDNLKKAIEDLGDYEIIQTTSLKGYTLLFKTEDNSFKNPYSEEKLIIKYGLKFLDKFPPPPTEIIAKIEEREDGKYIRWKINNASDVAAYSIYVRSLEPKTIDEGNLLQEGITNTEWKVDYINEIMEVGDKKQALQEGEEYWFYIIAYDNAGNKAEEIIPVQLTI